MQTPKHKKPIALQADQDDARPMGAGRRSYVRYPMVLDAKLITPEGHEIQCEMKDFCMGGMLLHFRRQTMNDRDYSFAEKDRFIVHSIVPLPDGDRVLRFQAQAARIMRDGLGVAFIDPEREALQIMQQFALQSPLVEEEASPRKSDSMTGVANGRGLFGRRFSDVIAGCGRVVQETMESLLEQLGARLANSLFELSRASSGAEEEHAYFKAANIIKESQSKLISDIRENFQERLQEILKNTYNPKQAAEQRAEDFSFEEMTLIGEADLGAWLAISDLANKVEERFKEALATLEERLSVLFNTQIGHTNNPYGPALFAESFQAGLREFNFKESVNAACFAVFKDILVGLLSDLYVKLNGILIGYGVLPDLTYNMLRRAAIQKSKPKAAVISDDTATPLGESAAAPVSRSDAGQSSSEKAGEQQDLYQVVKDLRALRYDLARQRSQLLPSSLSQSSDMAELMGMTSDGSDPGECYTTSELVAAITDLQDSPQDYEQGGDHRTHIKSRVIAALIARAGDDGVKKINRHDGNVLEVIGDLLDAMQGDPLVADSVKPWLRQLELPVLKLALLDPSLFIDHSHVARQVVNNIAKLEFYRQGSAKLEQSAISAAIEELLDKISRERSDGTETFEEILDKLNKLIKIQDSAYAENIRDVINECREHAPKPDVSEQEGMESFDIPAAERCKWMMHARRLREGDNVLHLAQDGTPQRLRVAWVDGRRSTYVLVNLRGIKERVLDVDGVAGMMHAGRLEPQVNAADPAMDRAQYVIMQDLYKQVLHESTHDGLTGLINRREFERLVNDAITSAKRDDSRHVLFFVDVDKFSAINNSCGYAQGDHLLKNLVGVIKDSLHGRGEIARLGSDQFGILIDRCSLDDALHIAEQQIGDVANYTMEWGDNVFSVTLSIGLVPVSARSGDVGELLQAAESSCNIAKDAGGNRLQVFHAGHARIAHQGEVMKWVGKIDKILKEDSLEIRCQRIEPLLGNGAEQPHYEILVGVKDERGNVGSPGEFIKAAEWYRRMSAVDRHVIERTLSWMESNPQIVEKIDGFSINLSGQSINEEGFVDFILEKLNGVSVPREKICFEVTETVSIASFSDATLFIESIKEAGCRFALDDFGSGMSSYGYLKNLPVDIVKIDGVFVQNLVADSSDYVVVKSITEIAHFMNKKVVAEFVENAEALELLREIGVDFVQGYMIDRPDSIDRLLDMNSPSLAMQ